MSESAASASPLHPHEPEIAPVLDAEGRCLVCKVQMVNSTLDHIVLAMQAAWIEWKHGDGAEHAMAWIENTLDGGDCLPDGAPEGASAQEFFDQGREAGRGN